MNNNNESTCSNTVVCFPEAQTFKIKAKHQEEVKDIYLTARMAVLNVGIISSMRKSLLSPLSSPMGSPVPASARQVKKKKKDVNIWLHNIQRDTISVI